MKKLISARLAANILLVLLGLMTLFHLLMLVGVLPYDFIWGGGIGSRAEMVRMELIALAATILIMVVVALKVGYLRTVRYQHVVNTVMWLIFVYFLMNTIGNLLSASQREALVFAPLALVMAFCALRLALEKEPVADGR